MFSLVERFLSIGGEAPMAGHPVYIIRLTGCNLTCRYCDTPYNDECNEQLSPEQLDGIIKEQSMNYPGLYFLFTGGEPLLENRQEELLKLIEQHPHEEFYFETNGTILLSEQAPENCHYVMDWKAPSSDHGDSFALDNLRRLKAHRDCLKFVIAREDLPWLKEQVEQCRRENPRLPLYVSPQWEDLPPKELVEYLLENRLDISLSMQIHKWIWPPEQRGV